MFNSASFSSASFSPVSWAGLTDASAVSHEVVISGKVYVRRKHKVYVFDSEDEARAFFAEQEPANDTPKTRKQRQKAIKRAIKVIQPEVIRLDAIEQAIDRFAIPFVLPDFTRYQDWGEFVRMVELIREMEDEEEVEMLLIA